MGIRIERFLQLKAFSYLVKILALIVLTNSSVNAQIDSLKTDSLSVKTTKGLFVKDSLPDASSKDTVIITDVDTTFFIPKNRKIIPARATLYSAILPGLGQAYNGRYWKIPIIYALFGTMYYFAADNNQKYIDFKYAYQYFDTDKQPEWVNESITDKNYLKDRMEFYKRNRDFNIILGGMFYLLNILDANVDAHLMDFDVSDDLSLRIEPDLNYYQAFQKTSNISGFGIKFVLSLNK